MRDRYCRTRYCFKRGCFVDVETQTLIKQLRRKAHLLVNHSEQMGFFNIKQQGEEIVTLLEMLERKIQK